VEKEKAEEKRAENAPQQQEQDSSASRVELKTQELYNSVPQAVKDLFANSKVKNGATLSAASMGSTSKMNKFSPPVELKEACRWIAEEDADVMLIFEDESSITFKDGKYLEHESMDE
jgi:hypothetical protein